MLDSQISWPSGISFLYKNEPTNIFENFQIMIFDTFEKEKLEKSKLRDRLFKKLEKTSHLEVLGLRRAVVRVAGRAVVGGLPEAPRRRPLEGRGPVG